MQSLQLPKLDSDGFQLVNSRDVFEWTHMYWPSIKRSCPPVQAVHVSFMSGEQSSEIKPTVFYSCKTKVKCFMTLDYVKYIVYLILGPTKCTLCFYLRADIFDNN